MLAYLVVKRFREGLSFKTILAYTVPAILFIGLWELWAVVVFGKPSAFYSYVYSGAPLALQLQFRVNNLYRSLVPTYLGPLHDVSTIAYEHTLNSPRLNSYLASQLENHPIMGSIVLDYIGSLPGVLMFSVSIFAYVSLWARIRQVKLDWIFLCLVPYLTGMLIFSYETFGLAFVYAQPIVPLLTALAVDSIGDRILGFVSLTSFLEHTFMMWGVMYPAYLLPLRLQHLQDGVLLLALSFVYAAVWLLLVSTGSFGRLTGSFRRIGLNCLGPPP